MATPNNDNAPAPTDSNDKAPPAPTPQPPASGEGATPADPSDKPLTMAQLDGVLNKIRSDEKAKHQRALEETRAQAAAEKERADAMEARLAAIEKEKADKANADLSDVERQEKRIRELEERDRQRAEELKAAAKASEDRVKASELRAYKQRRLREETVTLVELVSGATEKEIDDSITKAKKREAEIFGKAKAQADKEAEEQIAEARRVAGQKVPRPMAPAGPGTQKRNISPADRRRIARMKGADYERERKKILDRVLEQGRAG